MSTSYQTDQLIRAAGISAYAAQQSLQAARSFADSAHGINEGISDAVAKLQTQANIAERARQTLESDSKKSLDATIDGFHQDQRAWLSVEKVELTTQYSATAPGVITVHFKNSGNTPALKAGIAGASYNLDGSTPSMVKTIPGGTYRRAYSPGSVDVLSLLNLPAIQANKKITIRFTIEYFDVYQTIHNKPHITTFCGVYPSPVPSIFADCPNFMSEMK